ncbi:MAG: methyl-accepting chemotaxis protein [Candidatus Pacebacteria bacterium]|nr:methyl-accepting chemotaxis protein [Candidatus Paceibacterota bacterium]
MKTGMEQILSNSTHQFREIISKASKIQRIGLRKAVILALSGWLVFVVLASAGVYYVSSQLKESLLLVEDSLKNQYNNTLQIYESAITIQLRIQDIDRRINISLKTRQDTSSYLADNLEIIDLSLKELNLFAERIGSDRIGLISSRLNKSMIQFKEQVTTLALNIQNSSVENISGRQGAAMSKADVDEYFNQSDLVNGFASSLAGLSKTILDSANEELSAKVKAAGDSSNFNLIITAGFNLFFLVLLFAISYLVFRWVINPIIITTENINRVAGGNLNPPKTISSFFTEIQQVQVALRDLIKTSKLAMELREEQIAADEMKLSRSVRIEQNIEVFYASISKLLAALKDSAVNLRSAAEATLSVADDNRTQVFSATTSAEQARTQLASVANSTTELDSSIGDIVMQITRASTISDDARTATRRADDTMAALQDAVQRIGEVVNFIREIAEQTNLLALNATIESARAGAAGVGFAVVAREVKQLSSQTTEATSIISNHIQGVERATMDAITAVQSLRDMINEVNSLSSSVATAVTQQRHATSIIAENVDSISSQASDISKKMLTVSNSSASTTQTASSLLEAAEKLSQQAKNIEEDVNHFLQEIRSA